MSVDGLWRACVSGWHLNLTTGLLRVGLYHFFKSKKRKETKIKNQFSVVVVAQSTFKSPEKTDGRNNKKK